MDLNQTRPITISHRIHVSQSMYISGVFAHLYPGKEEMAGHIFSYMNMDFSYMNMDFSSRIYTSSNPIPLSPKKSGAIHEGLKFKDNGYKVGRVTSCKQDEITPLIGVRKKNSYPFIRAI